MLKRLLKLRNQGQGNELRCQVLINGMFCPKLLIISSILNWIFLIKICEFIEIHIEHDVRMKLYEDLGLIELFRRQEHV